MYGLKRRAMERGNGGRRLLAWDAPNMDMCLSEVIGERASAATRPNLSAVYAWLSERSLPGDTLEACVFCNVPPGFETAMTPWVVSLRHIGYSVFAKPKRTRADDVDSDIARHIERRFAQGSLSELVVASHDAKAFAAPLRRYAKAGVAVIVLGYREKDTFAATSPELIFVDMEDLPGAFERPLPRTNLFDLPPAGRWFEPFPKSSPAERTAPTAPRGVEPARRSLELDPERAPREQILELVEADVGVAVARGTAGLGLREVGDLLRLRFPMYSLEQLGFAGVADLVDAVERSGGLQITRLQDGGHLVSLRPGVQPVGRQAAEPETATRAETVETVEAVEAGSVGAESAKAESVAGRREVEAEGLQDGAVEAPSAEVPSAEAPGVETQSVRGESVLSETGEPLAPPVVDLRDEQGPQAPALSEHAANGVSDQGDSAETQAEPEPSQEPPVPAIEPPSSRLALVPNHDEGPGSTEGEEPGDAEHPPVDAATAGAEQAEQRRSAEHPPDQRPEEEGEPRQPAEEPAAADNGGPGAPDQDSSEPSGQHPIYRVFGVNRPA